MAGLPAGLAPAPTIQQVIGGIKSGGMSYGSSGGGGIQVSSTGQTTYYSGGGGGGVTYVNTPSQTSSTDMGAYTIQTTATVTPSLNPAPTSAFSLSSTPSLSTQTSIPFGAGYVNPITQQSVQTSYSSPQTQSVVSNYNPSDFQNKAPYGSPNLFENIGFAFGSLWKNRGELVDQTDKAFSGFSVFNRDINRSPVEPFGTRTSSQENYFYNQNKMTTTTDVPSTISSAVKSGFGTALLIAAPEVGFGYMVGKGYVDLAQGGGKMYNAMKEPDIGGYESFGMISTGEYGVTGSYNARGLQQDISSGRAQAIGGITNIGLGMFGFNMYKNVLSSQFIREDVISVINTRPTLSVSNIGKEGNIYTEAVTYNQKNPLGSAETIGAVRYEVAGVKYNILEGQSTTVVKVRDFFTGDKVIVSGQQSISGSGMFLPQVGGATPSFSKITSTETANAYFTKQGGKIEVFKGGEQTTNFYGGISKQQGQYALSLSGKTSEAGIDYGKIGSQIVNPNFNFKFPIEDIRISRITERTTPSSEFIPSSNLGLRANPSSPSSILSLRTTTQGTTSAIGRTLETNAPTSMKMFPKSANAFTNGGGQTTTQVTKSDFSFPSMTGSATSTRQDTSQIVIPKTIVTTTTKEQQTFKTPSISGNSNILSNPQRQDFFQVPIQSQPQITSQTQSQSQITKQVSMQTPRMPSPNVPFNPTSQITIPTIGKFPKFDLSGGSKNREFGARQRTKYTPDFAALVKGTKGKAPTGRLTGLEARPIPKGFSWAFSIGKMFRRRK